MGPQSSIRRTHPFPLQAGIPSFEQWPQIVWRVEPNDEEIAGYGRRVDETGKGDRVLLAIRSSHRPTSLPFLTIPVHQYKNLTYIVVRLAGHILPFDQPRSALDMITRWIRNKVGVTMIAFYYHGFRNCPGILMICLLHNNKLFRTPIASAAKFESSDAFPAAETYQEQLTRTRDTNGTPP